jgi:hypothetical protein
VGVEDPGDAEAGDDDAPARQQEVFHHVMDRDHAGLVQPPRRPCLLQRPLPFLRRNEAPRRSPANLNRAPRQETSG